MAILILVLQFIKRGINPFNDLDVCINKALVMLAVQII